MELRVRDTAFVPPAGVALGRVPIGKSDLRRQFGLIQFESILLASRDLA